MKWNRTTVAKFETFQRNSISVQELLALALVLDVPPMALLADPRHVDEVPVAEGVTVTAWEALLWLAGTGTISESDLDNYTSAAWLIQSGWGIVESVAELRKQERRLAQQDPEQAARSRQRDDDRHRDALNTLGACIGRIRAAGAPLPPMPVDFLRQRADELDVELPDMGT